MILGKTFFRKGNEFLLLFWHEFAKTQVVGASFLKIISKIGSVMPKKRILWASKVFFISGSSSHRMFFP